MTLKQQEFIRKLPENGLNMAKTMREVGYSDSTSRSGRMYALLRKQVEKAYNPDEIKREIDKARKRFQKSEDNSNYARMLELQAKIAGLTKDQQSQGVIVNVNDAIAQLKGNITGNQKLESPCATTG